jgi:replication-associated recombination protein RarA
MAFEGIHQSVAKLLENFVKSPETLSHLLFVGPPGSGKTTTANAFVEAMYGKRKHYTGRALFLNSSDERSLESVRSKVYPFASSQISNIFEGLGGPKLPKIIIFDEAETLTEQAQTALRPLLDKPASEILIFFLCNSVSKIHPSILHRFLRITFETPSADQFKDRLKPIMAVNYPTWKEKQIQEYVSNIPNVDIVFRRGDIRFFLLQLSKSKESQELYDTTLNGSTKDLRVLLENRVMNSMYSELIAQFLFLFYSLGVLSVEDIKNIFTFGECDLLRVRTRNEFIEDLLVWVNGLLQKLEGSWETL